MVVKAGLGLIGIALVSAGSVAVAKPGLLGMMPNYTALSKDHDFESNYGDSSSNKGKFGAVNKENLVGVVGTTNSTSNEKSSVEDWWKWSYENLKKDKISSGKFAVENTNSTKIKVNSAYSSTSSESTSSPKALNRVCEDAYKSETSNITSDADENKYKEAHVWKYCSWLGKKPVSQQQ